MVAMLEIDIENILKKDGVIIHHTDTVCGISGSYLSEKAYQTIYDLKKRNFDKPLGILLADLESILLFSDITLGELAPVIPFLERGMTILLKRKDNLPLHLLNQSALIGVRIPNHAETKALIKRCGPLMCTSANISGFPPVTSKKESLEFFSDILFIESETGGLGVSSSILSYIDGNYTLIREGNITKAEITNQVPLSI
jgi:L-threonylcarbamoyladenylate synthase